MYTYLQAEPEKSGTFRPDHEVTNGQHTEYIPTVVGSATELVESHKNYVNSVNSVNTDHVYHKNIKPFTPTVTISPLDSPEVNFTELNLTSLCDNSDLPVLELSAESGMNFYTTSQLDPMNIGSDGSRSPYSDISSAFSPTSADDLNSDWNDSFTDLFPQLLV